MAAIYLGGAPDREITETMIDAVLAHSSHASPRTRDVTVTDANDSSTLSTALMALASDDVAVVTSDVGPLPTTAARTVTFGLTGTAQFRATDLDAGLDSTTFVLHAEGVSRTVQLALVGERMVVNALAALAAGRERGVPLTVAISALEEMTDVGAARMRRYDRSDGVTVLDDTAEATPRSMADALKTLALVCGSRRSVAVLGALSVVGDASEVFAAHDRIGRLVVRLNIKQLIVVGHDARHIHNAAGLEGSWDGESLLVRTQEQAYDIVRGMLRDQDVVLVKASQSAGLGHLASRLAGETA